LTSLTSKYILGERYDDEKITVFIRNNTCFGVRSDFIDCWCYGM
jgi:hypothetical protein